MRRTFTLLGDGRVRLALLLALLATLVVYVLATRTGALGSASDSPRVLRVTAVGGCPTQDTPAVTSVSRSTLRELREDLRGVMFGKRRELYEQGVIASSNAWSDDEPGKHRTLPRGPRDPGGYELRWWASNRDDVVADVFVFARSGQARDFFLHASSGRCRLASGTRATASPPGGQNLQWRNPDGFAQEDVYLLRGRRVYRVSVVRARAGKSISATAERSAFSLVDGLACTLPEAECHPRNDQALAEQTLAEQLTLVRRQLPGGETFDHSAGAEHPEACTRDGDAYRSATGRDSSETLSYEAEFELRLGVRIYQSAASAQRTLAQYTDSKARRCLAQNLIGALRARHYRVGSPREHLARGAFARDALVEEIAIPVRYAHRSYSWTLEDIFLAEHRIVELLGTLAPAPTFSLDERLATRLARALR